MERLHELDFARKAAFSERFETLLPQFLMVLEREWCASRSLMSAEEQGLMREAHSALGTLNELQDGAL